MTRFSNLPEHAQLLLWEGLNAKHASFTDAALSAREQVSRYLMLANSGGVGICVAVMVGLVKQGHSFLLVLFPLAFFLCGFVVVGWAKVLDAEAIVEIREHLRETNADIVNDRLSMSELEQFEDDFSGALDRSRDWWTGSQWLFYGGLIAGLLILALGLQVWAEHPDCTADFLARNPGEICEVIHDEPVGESAGEPARPSSSE